MGLEPDLCMLRVFGTDDEALYSLFQHEFTEETKYKLHELQMCEGTVKVTLGDIFGWDVKLERMDGLADAESKEELDKGVQFFCQK